MHRTTLIIHCMTSFKSWLEKWQAKKHIINTLENLVNKHTCNELEHKQGLSIRTIEKLQKHKNKLPLKNDIPIMIVRYNSSIWFECIRNAHYRSNAIQFALTLLSLPAEKNWKGNVSKINSICFKGTAWQALSLSCQFEYKSTSLKSSHWRRKKMYW